MLKARVISAVLMAAPVLALLFVLPASAWRLLVLGIMWVTSWELLRLSGYRMESWQASLAPTLLTGMLLIGVLWLPMHWQWWLVHIACAAWLAVMLVLVRHQYSDRQRVLSHTTKLLLAALFVLPTLTVISMLQAYSPWLIVALLTIVWAADVFAFFVGRALGGPKLASRISPNKTWAGFAGGLLGATMIGSIWIAQAGIGRQAPVLGAVAVIVIASVSGDLLASLLKRQAQRKDSSNLIPGHGGLVDRLDSLMAASPFYALAVKWAVFPVMLPG